MQGVALLGGLEDVDVHLELLDLGSLQSVIDFSKRFNESNTKVVFFLPRNNERMKSFRMRHSHVVHLVMLPSCVSCGVTLLVNYLCEGMLISRSDRRVPQEVFASLLSQAERNGSRTSPSEHCIGRRTLYN